MSELTPLLVINMRDSSILLQVNIQPGNSSASISLQIDIVYAHLSGLKSLVTIDPGSMTLVSFGSSALANVYCHQYIARPHVSKQLTVASEFSPIFFPTNLFIHSSVLLSPEVEVIPGTTRGILRLGLV